MQDTSLRGRAVVITGASSGFGKGAALAFAEAGADVVLAARRADLLDELADLCRAWGGRAVAVCSDVSDSVSVARLLDAATDELGRLDVWINNAGVGALGPFERVPLADHKQVIATNLLGTLYGSYFAYQYFVSQGHGVLINVASELGRHTIPYYASYVASKHGVVGLGTALRQEIDQREIQDVHVCTVLPTAHDTPFFDHASNYTGHEVQAPKPLHDPQNVVDALVRLARNPKDEEIVGADGVVKILMARWMPGVAEKLGAQMMHRTQMEQSPPAPDSPGAVRTPSEIGTEVTAGRRELEQEEEHA
jgi:short-subunit dehydrogenase